MMIKVYVKLNENNEIIDIASSIFLNDTNGYICIDEGDGDKFAHAQSHYLEKGLVDEFRYFNYKYVDNCVMELTQEEKKQLHKEDVEVEPTREDIIEAQVMYTALMTDTLLGV